ncbi:uncharacterized protein LOC105181768 isoform X2 [Harpegnathos saltator]|uniref:uncharacterized protein LOC105181768 isoform X2 n=1 Tax=Harpegnathos saltator TaxID=610380 RepID=UPI00058B9EB8|nr:uncharacterized protein LOC105181768 isoform X2 [Harpegnathos saltator]
MDAALNSKCADLFVNDWINNSHEILYEHVQSINDETNNVILRFKTIQAPIVKAAFKVYEHLKEHLKPQKVRKHTKYMAIMLYDEFLHKYFIKLCKTRLVNGPLEEQWDNIYNEIINKTKLHLLSCFQLALKMDKACAIIEISEILNLLNVDHEETYTYDAIIAAEYDVFRTVDFKMPLNTPITCVETLLAAANLESKIYRKTAAVLLDISFLQFANEYFHILKT